MDNWENHFDLFEKNNSSSWQAAAASLWAQQGRSELRAGRPEQIKSISIKSAELDTEKQSECGGGRKQWDSDKNDKWRKLDNNSPCIGKPGPK